MALWEDLLRNAIGPLLSALIVGVFATWIAARAQERRADRDRNAEDRRAENARAAQDYEEALKLRHEIIGQMTEAASALYIGEQEYWRAKKAREADDPELAQSRRELDQQYRACRVAGEVLERQLEAYFESDEPRLQWHATMDLLTVRYFQLIDQASYDLLNRNARHQDDYHSGLTVGELFSPSEVLKGYRATLPRATEAVLHERLRSRTQ